jgi:hypothetical protein
MERNPTGNLLDGEKGGGPRGLAGAGPDLRPAHVEGPPARAWRRTMEKEEGRARGGAAAAFARTRASVVMSTRGAERRGIAKGASADERPPTCFSESRKVPGLTAGLEVSQI